MARRGGRARQAPRPQTYQSDALGQVTVPEPERLDTQGMAVFPDHGPGDLVPRAELRAAVAAVASEAMVLVDALERRLRAASGGHLDDAVVAEITAGRQAVASIIRRYTE